MIQPVYYYNSTRFYNISRRIRFTKRSSFYFSELLDAFGLNPRMILTALRFFPLSSLGDDPHQARVSQPFAPMLTLPPFLCS